MSQITGATAIIRCLEEQRVSTVFGYPGGAVIDLYDELIQHSDINHILVRHEQGAVHAADGYARVTGEVGVALLTSGPGATNGVTGIATAYLDSVPLVILTGQVPTAMIGNDAFQEVDIVGITRPCTKHNYLVKQKDDLVPTIREAFHIARTGRPGPVLVDLPKDIVKALISFPEKTQIKLPNYHATHDPDMHLVAAACRMIMEAHRPVLYVGGGTVLSGASQELYDLATKLDIPVTTTLMAMGAFPGCHELAMGMLGMHGTYTANMAVAEADLLISVGARFDDRVTGKLDSFAPRARIIHIDIDPTSISKNVKVDIPLVSDCKKALTAMNNWFNNDQQVDISSEKGKHQAWIAQIQEWNNRHPLAYYNEGDDIIKPQYVVEMLDTLTKGEAIIATEVGQHQMWAAQFYRYNSPRHFLTSGGLGTMGYGLPAAIGAKLARPDKVVIDIAGDASIQMNIQELATARQYGAAVKVAILNNRYLGMVRQWQELFYDRRYSATEMDVAPDFVALAEAYGAVGLRATKQSEVIDVIKEALRVDNTVLMDFQISREESVYPMVPAGKATTEMLLV